MGVPLNHLWMDGKKVHQPSSYWESSYWGSPIYRNPLFRIRIYFSSFYSRVLYKPTSPHRKQPMRPSLQPYAATCRRVSDESARCWWNQVVKNHWNQPLIRHSWLYLTSHLDMLWIHLNTSFVPLWNPSIFGNSNLEISLFLSTLPSSPPGCSGCGIGKSPAWRFMGIDGLEV